MKKNFELETIVESETLNDDLMELILGGSSSIAPQNNSNGITQCTYNICNYNACQFSSCIFTPCIYNICTYNACVYNDCTIYF